jgi:non-specific serine/threonine protein kinase
VLLAEGKSNRAVADCLLVTARTAAKHVENILAKLGFSSRAQIAVWAANQPGLRTQPKA